MSKHGLLEELTLLQNPEHGMADGQAFVKFKYREDAIQAFLVIFESNTQELRHHSVWHIEWASQVQREMHISDKCSLFVGQLDSQHVTQKELADRFGQYGEMAECTLVNKSQSNQQCTFFD